MLRVQVISFGLIAFWRAFHFSAMSTYVALLFGFSNFGKLWGLAFCISGVINLGVFFVDEEVRTLTQTLTSFSSLLLSSVLFSSLPYSFSYRTLYSFFLPVPSLPFFSFSSFFSPCLVDFESSRWKLLHPQRHSNHHLWSPVRLPAVASLQEQICCWARIRSCWSCRRIGLRKRRRYDSA